MFLALRHHGDVHGNLLHSRIHTNYVYNFETVSGGGNCSTAALKLISLALHYGFEHIIYFTDVVKSDISLAFEISHPEFWGGAFSEDLRNYPPAYA